MITSIHSEAQSLALDQRLRERKQAMAAHQSELARAKALAGGGQAQWLACAEHCGGA
jgi:hypothetical protein